jgi:hypothetical protein
VTTTILRYMLTLATKFTLALATPRIMSASEARGVGAGAPVSAGAIFACTGAPDKLDKFSTRLPPPAPPAGEAVEVPSGAVVPGPSARGTADMAGAARDEERTGRGAHEDERTHRRHRSGRGWRRGHLKRCIVAAPIFVHNEGGENDPCSRHDCERDRARMRMPTVIGRWQISVHSFYNFSRYRTNLGQECSHVEEIPVSQLTGHIVEVANPNNPDLDLISMKQFLVKAAKLGNPKLGAEAYGLYTVSKL